MWILRNTPKDCETLSRMSLAGLLYFQFEGDVL